MYVWISASGELHFVYDDRLRGLLGLGEAHITRASHVEPTPDGRWTADLGPSGGPVLGPFPLRQQALDEERRWLEAHLPATAAAPEDRRTAGTPRPLTVSLVRGIVEVDHLTAPEMP